MARVKYYDQASQEWKYADAALNMKGKDGYTPQKGIDYFTEEDVRELTENVLDQGVLTYNEQELTEDQKAQARENIGIDQISFDKLTENLDADGFRITNLPLPQSGSEPATKEFVENFTFEGSTYVATDDGEGNVVIRPYQADEDELVFNGHIQNKDNPHGVTAAQVGAATHADVNAAVKTAAPRNLLDNSDFRNPVNQRGQNSYAGKIIGIDRWQGGAGAALVTVVDEGIKISYNEANGGTGTQPLMQYVNLSEGDAGKTVTFAARIKGGDVRIYFKGASLSYVSASDWTVIVYTGVIPANTEGFYVGLQGKNKSETLCEWMALYEGEYTVETLPVYQPKGYENELLVCHQYDGNTYIGLRKFGQPKNLLDNSDFRNPVNQKGVIVSSNGLIVDRWYVFNRTDDTNDTATLTADGIVTNGASYLQQRIPKGIIKDGEKYTLAVHYSDGTVDVNTNGEYMIFDGFDLVNYITSNGKTIASIALYEGEYTIDTLPKYQPKGYGAELAECQRYYQIINNGIGSVRTNEDKILVTLPLCVSMRNEISVASATIATVRANGLRIDNPEFEINAIAYVDYYSACVLELAGTFTGMGNGIAYIDGRFHLSAEFL